MTTRHSFRTYEGNMVALPFELRREGVRGAWDVSTASQIALEVTTPAGVNMAPIPAQSAHPDANWAAGIVVVVISGSNVTAAIGTYPYSLTVSIAGQVITAGTGLIEVLDRPGFAP
jgi:hypothetical protein